MEKYYATRFQNTDIRKNAWIEISSYLTKIIPIKKTDVVLDLGAGYCYFINNISCKEKHALDISKYPLLNANKDIKIHIGSCTKMSFLKNNYFDVVFSSNLLEHLTLEEIFLTLKEVRRILKYSGKFVILVPNYRYCYKEYFDDYTHKTILNHINIKDILESNDFSIQKIIPRFLPFSTNNVKIFNKWLLFLYLRSPIKPLSKQMLIIAKKLH